MAIKYDKKLPSPPEAYTPPEFLDDGLPTADYPIYVGASAGTPYIPEVVDTAWYDDMPYWEPGKTADVGTVYPDEDRPIQQTPSQFNAVYQDAYAPEDNVDFFKQISERHNQHLPFRDSSYATYSGSDIVATMTLPNSDIYTFGDISTITVSVHRESFPVRIIGRSNVIGFTRGPRTIAGSIIFTSFDLYPLYRAIGRLADTGAEMPWTKGNQGVYPLADSLPPFDLTLTFSNEYGAKSVMRIYGIVLVDDGVTLSVDDLITENVYSYMAAGIAPMHHPEGWKVAE